VRQVLVLLLTLVLLTRAFRSVVLALKGVVAHTAAGWGTGAPATTAAGGMLARESGALFPACASGLAL